MSNFAVLLLKEERALFSSPIAYVVMTVFLLIMGYSSALQCCAGSLPNGSWVFELTHRLLRGTDRSMLTCINAEKPQ